MKLGIHGLRTARQQPRVLLCLATIRRSKYTSSLYVVAALLRRKGLKYWKNKLLYEILQSTLFLGTNGCLFISFFCVWRKLIGKLYMLNLAYLPALCASYVAILLERKSRRGILAAYTSNVLMMEIVGWQKFLA
ncbi:transmembrane protein 135-like isoform X2 [Liolophura sinensis]|uniref:transmembrane protein 135-like isoform X2 n=1 Tax=Liolophura sinensis TaxID=3198878 RepID=UPI0031592EB8